MSKRTTTRRGSELAAPSGSRFSIKDVRARCVLHDGRVCDLRLTENEGRAESATLGQDLLSLLDDDEQSAEFREYSKFGSNGALLCAFWSRRNRSVPSSYLSRFVDGIVKATRPKDRQGFRAVIEVDGWRFTAQLIDIAQVSVTLPLLETFDQARGDVPNAGEILADIEAVQGPIIHKLNAWLSSFEGKTFPCEDAMRQVAEITSLVARAGCTLMHEGQPVSIYVTTPPDQKNATINVSTLGVRPQRTLLARTKVPRLSARPVAVE